MAWNYRKRIKIAPGVHLNLSKGGVSTSIGPKGAKVTIGKKGTYLHTSIPGTGLYSRKKVSRQNNKKTTNSKGEQMMRTTKDDGGFFMPKNTWGCVFRWLGLIAIIFLVVNLVQLIIGSFDNSKDNMTALRFFGFIATIFIIVYLRRVLSFIKGLVDFFRNIFPSKPCSAEKIDRLISEENDENRKVFLLGLETLYKKEKADEIISFDDGLTDNQMKTYKNLSDSFSQLCSCDKIWMVLSKTNKSNYKSPASSNVDRKSVRLTSEIFNNVTTKVTSYVPSFNDGHFYYYIYPQYVVRAVNATHFDVFPIADVVLKYESHIFIEDPDSSQIPSDSKIINYAYNKTNKDGTPDLRFKDNKKRPVYHYGGINIETFSLSYIISNIEKAKAFTDSFAKHKAAMLCKPNQNKSDNTITKELPHFISNTISNNNKAYEDSCKNGLEPNENIFGVTETYFNKAIRVAMPLCDFYDKILLNKRIMLTIDGALSDQVGDSIAKLRFLLLSDLIKCYNHLGHEATNLLTIEGVPMAILEGHIISKTIIPYSSIQLYEYRKVIESINSVNKIVVENFPKDKSDDFFYLNEVFKSCNSEDLRTQYFSLLYRFFSVIAKADDHIMPEEGKWLEMLLSYSTTGKDYGLEVFEKKASIDEKLSKEKQATPIARNDDKINPLEELLALIGLSEVKQDVSALSKFVRIQQEREKKGLKSVDLSYHCVFTGNPGTGKTTVARILADIYKDLGILEKGHLIETDRSGLVAEYVGQTAVKTNKIIDSALDGVLFIDEAYSLVQGGSNDFGQEAISTLLKRMEDNRNRLVVVLAGYSEEMKRFIDSNPGLQSRFTRYIHFADYTAVELKQIFMLNVKKNQYILEPKGEEKLSNILNYAVGHKDKSFGNGRYVRNLFEKTIQNQAIRLSCKPSVTAEELSKLEAVDLQGDVLETEDLLGNAKKEDNPVEENNSSLIKRKPRLDLDLIFNGQNLIKDGDYIVLLTDGSGNEVKDENGVPITAKYIGDNFFECRGEKGRSSYFAKKYLNQYAGKNLQTVNGNEYWTFNGKKLTLLRKN